MARSKGQLLILARDGKLASTLQPVDYKQCTSKIKSISHSADSRLEHVNRLVKNTHSNVNRELIALQKSCISALAATERENFIQALESVCDVSDEALIVEWKHQNDTFSKYSRSIIERLSSIKSQGGSNLAALLKTIEGWRAELTREQVELLQQSQSIADDVHVMAARHLAGNGLYPDGAVPADIDDFPLDDRRLKLDLLHQFALINADFSQRLNALTNEQNCLRGELCLLSDDDIFELQSIVKGFARLRSNPKIGRRLNELLMHQLRLHFPGLSKAQLLEHRLTAERLKAVKQRQKLTSRLWREHLLSYAQKVRSIFAQFQLEQQAAERHKRQLCEQQQLCAALCEQLMLWREHKSVEDQRTLDQLDERRKRDELISEATAEYEALRRDVIKEQIGAFHSKVAHQEQLAAEQERRLLRRLDDVKARQAAHDQQRIFYRRELYSDKLQAMKHAAEQLAAQRDQLEQRLEALRQLVRVEAVFDPMRLHGDTAASKAKSAPEQLPCLQTPLFKVNGFTADEVLKDPRVRYEQAVRDAGLLHSDYARQILKVLPPPTAPRKDMQSRVFEFD